jgi:hypothetical protein
LPEVGREWPATAVAEKEPAVEKRNRERGTGAGGGFCSGEKGQGSFCKNDVRSSKSRRREYHITH